jgi:hypothetical protein
MNLIEGGNSLEKIKSKKNAKYMAFEIGKA